MEYGEKGTRKLINTLTRKPVCEETYTYRYAAWKDWHTNDEGDGLWCGDRQIVGTCDFTVRGCRLETSAVAKIRRFVNGN